MMIQRATRRVGCRLPAASRAFSSLMQEEKQYATRSYDDNFDHYQRSKTSWDPTGRTFHYAVNGSARFLYGSVARVGVLKFVASLSAAADVLAMSTIEVDISGLPVGKSLTAKWRGKPVFIRHRTPEEIAVAAKDDTADLRDPETDAERAVDPNYLVLIGICTHLGCVPYGEAGDYGGWFCPCHGSHYDTSGRLRAGPAPLNLEVPPYKYIGDKMILIG